MSIVNDTSAQMEFGEKSIDTAPLGSVISSDHSDGKSSPRLASSTATSVAPESIPDIAQDPSVITGLAFRLPGAKTLSQLWDNVVSQKDLQQKIPSDRFNVDAFYNPQGVNKGTTNARYGYFLEEPLTQFDNEFFRISRQEAESMDPQQRLLLEVVYEALEDAGIPLSTIRGSRTAVMVGSFTNDYNAMTTKDLATYPKYNITGTGNSILANRISYFYDLHGPSMTVDTACSSSLVCFHLGNQSLRNGESDIAIIAGSSLHFDPNIYITMTDFGMLSTDGRCRSFDKDGSGYVRGEGVCAMVLKRQSSAEASGDRIRAIVRGTGSNHDGSKSGLTLPNGAAQAQLIRQVYKDAGLDMDGTDYFEAHGTGTKAGDPIEANAIGSVFAPRRDRPLYLGSIKSNLGHLEGASGLAGIAKAILSVSSGKILPNMHFNNPNPAIDFGLLKLKVPTELTDWPTNDYGVRRASVNSFGYGGSNSHVILENYTPRSSPSLSSPEAIAEANSRPFLIPLTAHNDGAAKNNVESLKRFIDQNRHLSPADLAYSYSVRRSRLQLRSFVIGTSQDELISGLDGISKWTSPLSKSNPRLGFVFTGQGAQWYAMGRELIEKSPLFFQTIEKCDQILSELPDKPEWTVLEELLKTKETSRLSESLLSQPLCAALQLAIVDLLKQWGIVPSAVVGHSSGEIAAAYAAGILSFRNAIICAYYRGLYMSAGKTLAQKGAMMAVGMTVSEGRTLLEPYTGRIALAAVNSPTSLTLSGDEDAIVELKAELDKSGVFNRRLRVEQAFHSHHMVPLAPGFEAALSKTPGFRSDSAQVRMVSSVTGRDASARVMDAAYWAANMTGVVRFADALTGILLDEKDEPDVDILVEIGAHPALKGPAMDVVKSTGLELPYVGSLTRDKPAFESLLACAGELHGLGYNVDLAASNSDHWLSADGEVVGKSTVGRPIHDLPAYGWDHGTHWAETRVIRQHRLRPSRHTLLGAVVPGTVDKHPTWRNYLKISEIPWLSEHVIQGKILFPAAGYISMALEAVASISTGSGGFKLRDVSFKSALVLSESDDVGTEILLELQPLAISAKSTSTSWYTFSISTYDDRENLVEHCRGQICAESQGTVDPWTAATLAEVRLNTDRRKPSSLHYKQLRSVGLDYGEKFRLISNQIESGPGYSLAGLTFSPSKVVAYYADQCILHPTILDSAFHAIFSAIETRTGKPLSESFVPTFIRSADFSESLLQRKTSEQAQELMAHCSADLPGTRVAHSTLQLLNPSAVDGQHEVLVKLDGLELTALGNESEDAEDRRNLFFNISWAPLFSYLGSGEGHDRLPGSIAETVMSYCHEVPDSSIMHFTSSRDTIEAVISGIGGSNGQDRKFGRLNVRSQLNPQGAQQAFQEIEPTLKGLIEHVEPETNKYDLVVLHEAYEGPIESLLKPEAVVISATTQTLSDVSFKKLFGTEQFTVWKALPGSKNETMAEKEDITVLISKRASAETEAIVSDIKSSYPTTVHVLPLGANSPSTTQVISLVSLDEDFLFDPETEAEHLAAVQALVAGPAENVVWLTRDAAIDSLKPEQAVINGLFRSIRSENDGSRFATLDLESKTISDASYISDLALRVLLEITNEDELAERNKVILAPRAGIDNARNSKLPFIGNRRVQQALFHELERPLALKIGKIGLLNSLAFGDDEDIAASELPDDHLEIQVGASALNSRDIAIATGATDESHLGDEAAGTVVRVGKHISPNDFKVGDRVIALRPGQGAHRTLVRNSASLCLKIDDGLSFEQAISFPLVLTTAYYSLYTIGRLQQSEYCLIHSAAGGLGQMAVQLAQRVGARVIATVSSPEKRTYIRDRFGVPDSMIFSSQDDSFVEGVLAVTGGRGVDVALNSLTGELLHKTWSCVAPLGRLIEIGKRDIQENTKLEMRPFHRGVTFASVDIATLFRASPELLSQQLEQAFTLVKEGQIEAPGPLKTFTYGDAQTAFKTLQKRSFFGKVVLVPDSNELVPIIPASFTDGKIFASDKSYLLVGGLGGIGRSLAEWMFSRGARKICFLSRSGAQTRDAQETVSWLNERGAETSVFKANVDRLEEVKPIIESLRDTLGGIFQAAMVLRDGPFGQMTAADWRSCVHPKTIGTHNLHVASEGIDLDFFVCFSSMSSVVGTAGQSNYSAANSYIDALMAHRRANGLAGTTMNVGVVGDVGAVAEDDGLATILDRMGYDFISQNELFYQVEEAVLTSKQYPSDALPGPATHQIISGINTKRKDVYWGSKPLWRNLYGNLDLKSSGSSKGKESLSVLLSAATSPEERVDILTNAFINKVSAVMGTPAESIQKAQPLTAYGLDSIVAVEFRKWFTTAINADVPLFDILGSKSIKALTTKALMSIKQEDNAQNSNVDSSSLGVTSSNSGSSGKRGKRGFEIQPRAEKHNTPLSSFQRRMWFLHNISADQSTLNLLGTFILQGQPRLDVLQRTFEELARRNEILRTIYEEGDDFTEQLTADEFQSQIELQDISSASDTTAAFLEVTKNLRSQPIDLDIGESMKVRLIKMAEDKYALVLSFHHINLDNGSTKTILDQFTQLYDAISRQKDLAKIPAPRISYADFAVWHNEFLETAETSAHIDWWKENLRGIPESSSLLPFSSAKERPAGRPAERLTKETSVSSTVLKRLKRISSATNATPFHFLIAAFRAFIYRYTEDDDLTFLIVDGTRPHTEVSDIMGFFVNLVPLRLFLEAAELDFETLLSYVAKASFEALAHNSVPFDSIIDNVGVKRSTSCFPISQIMVNYQIYGKPPVVSTVDFDITDIDFKDIPTPGDISLEAIEDPAVGLTLRLQYDPVLYASGEMDRFLENFTVFLADVTRDHRQPINEIAMTGPMELQYLRENCWGLDVTEDLWQNRSIVTKVLDIAKAQPASIAIETSAGETITYGELVNRAKQISLRLENNGISTGSLVAAMYKPGIDMVAALLGIVLSGAGYLPLDPDFAIERLKHMVGGAHVSAILVQQEYRQLADELANGIRVVQAEGVNLAAEAWREKRNSPADPFYVIYTSGSTGKPKGVLLTHANTRAMLSAHNTRHNFSAKDRILFLTSFTWDVSVAQIWGSLTSGATMLLAKEDTRKDPDALALFLLKSGASVTYTTPTQYASLLLRGREKLSRMRKYRAAIFAGEALSSRLVKDVYDLGIQGLKVYNEFGPSEATVQTTCYEATYPESADGYVPIGYGLANCSHYAVDSKLKPVPATVIGELCEGGPQVGAGYIGQPDATAKVYVKNPFATQDHLARGWNNIYRTGDRMRFLPDGQMEYKGRIAGDAQVKLRGFRIELGEIENEMTSIARQMPDKLAAEGAVICRRLGSDDEAAQDVDDRQLIAFLVTPNVYTKEEKESIVNALHSQLKNRLNYYMVPNGYHFTAALPTLPSGKRNRRALHGLELNLVYPRSDTKSSAETSGAKVHSDGSDILEKVVDYFRKVLKLGPDQDVNPNTSFFDLGGHSLLVLRLVAQIKKGLNVKLEVRDIFSDLTPMAVTRVVAERLGVGLAVVPESTLQVDWKAEATLPSDASFYPASQSKDLGEVDRPESILLTGADSVMGVHLLVRLLNNGASRILALGTESPLSLESLESLFKHHNLVINESEKWSEHVEILPGSLAETQLGLDDETFHKLGQSLTTVYHFGSQVSLLKSYSDLKRINISATQDVIRLAALGAGTSIHYLSSWSVLHLQLWSTSSRQDSSTIVKDERVPDFFTPTGSEYAYFKTRWAAEVMLSEAAKRGIPTSIYRSSGLDDNSSGRENNFYLGLIREMIQSGIVPDFGTDGFDADFVTADYVADMVLRLQEKSQSVLPEPQVFHIRNPSAVSLKDLPEAFANASGKERAISLVSVDDWLTTLEQSGEVSAAVMKEYIKLGHRMFSLDDLRTREVLDRGDGSPRAELDIIPRGIVADVSFSSAEI